MPPIRGGRVEPSSPPAHCCELDLLKAGEPLWHLGEHLVLRADEHFGGPGRRLAAYEGLRGLPWG